MKPHVSLLLLVMSAAVLHASPPPDYYTPAHGKAGPELLPSRHDIIRGHVNRPACN